MSHSLLVMAMNNYKITKLLETYSMTLMIYHSKISWKIKISATVGVSKTRGVHPFLTCKTFQQLLAPLNRCRPGLSRRVGTWRYYFARVLVLPDQQKNLKGLLFWQPGFYLTGVPRFLFCTLFYLALQWNQGGRSSKVPECRKYSDDSAFFCYVIKFQGTHCHPRALFLKQWVRTH